MRCVNVNGFTSCKRARLSVYRARKTLICVSVFNHIFLTVIWRLELRDVARLVLLFMRPMTSMRLSIGRKRRSRLRRYAVRRHQSTARVALNLSFLGQYRDTSCHTLFGMRSVA